MSELLYRHFERYLEKFLKQGKKVSGSKYLYSTNAVKTYAKRLYSTAKSLGALKESHPRELFNGKYKLQRYVNSLPGKQSGYTVRATCSAINHFAKICGKEGIKPPKVSCPSAAGTRGYTPDQIRQIEAEISRYGKKYQTAFRFAVESGCRLSEIKTVQIAKQNITTREKDGSYRVLVYKGQAFISGKGGRCRPVPTTCSKETLKSAMQNAAHCPKEKTLRNRLYEAVQNLGIHEKGNGFHGLRHSWARERILEGWSLREVSQAMGHDREYITKTYLK